MKNKIFNTCMILFIAIGMFTSCNDKADDKNTLITGLWVQEKVEEDGVELNIPSNKQVSLLIEQNGVYRTFAAGALPAIHYGSWTITDNQWFEITADVRQMVSNPLTQTPDNQWRKNHILVRFTILKVTNDVLEFRIKTFVGLKKYAALFVEEELPVVTADNYEALSSEFKELKTYIYYFKKK